MFPCDDTVCRKTYGMDGTVSGTAGGFSAMTQDALTVLNDIPFSIPPYFALLARAIVTLEGVALTGDPAYGIILESYPFVARKLLSEDRPEIQRALQQVLYAKGSDGLQATRLSVLLNSALGVVARQSGGAFVDFDSIPEGAVDLTTSVKFLLSEKAVSLREVLIEEAVNAADILIRQASRKAFNQVTTRLPVPPFFGRFLPRPENIRAPFLIPSPGGGSPFTPVFMTPLEMLEIAVPKLNREEEFFAISLSDAATQTLGEDAGVVVRGDALMDPAAALRVVLGITSSNSVARISNPIVADISKNILSALSANKPQRVEPVLTTVSIDNMAMNGDVNDGIRNIPALHPQKDYSTDNGLNNLADGLGDLNAAEEEALEATATTIFNKLLDRIIARLQLLVK